MATEMAISGGKAVCRRRGAVRSGNAHFTDESVWYKLVWLFVLGSFSGFLVETVWCVIRFGHLEVRSGFVIGPFNPVYGLGVWAMYLTLRKLGRGRPGWVFTGGVVVGTAVEYLCSFLQERAFGTVSWDYSAAPLNIGGRVCLLYSVFWGLLALLWVYLLEPVFDRIIRRVPNSYGKSLSLIVTVLFVLNAAISVAAVSRWVERADAVPADHALSVCMDRYFPDGYMETMYPNMVISA